MSARRSFLASLLALFLTTTLVHSVQSQPIWIIPENHHQIVLEWLNPDIEGFETSFATGTWFLSAFVAASDGVRFVVEVPYTHFAATIANPFLVTPVEVTESGLGNVYLGLEFGGKETPITGEIGIRLPTVGDEAGVGAMSDFVDRAEAFVTDAFPFYAFVNFIHRVPDGLVARIRGGVTVWLPRNEARNGVQETEAFVLYGGQVGYAGRTINLLTGITGRWFATSNGASFGEASFHQLGVSVDLPLGTFQPGVSFRFLEPFGLVDLQPTVLPAPAVKRLSAYADLATGFRRCRSARKLDLGLAQFRHDLLHAVAFPGHTKTPFFERPIVAKLPLTIWTDLRGSGHGSPSTQEKIDARQS